MRTTPFPTHPSDVAALTVLEFTWELGLGEPVSLAAVCHRFLDDSNRALVWFIRYRALTAWCGRADSGAWLQSQPTHAQHACALAATFELNADWEFDAERFRAAVQADAR